jgi:hypothetical protein
VSGVNNSKNMSDKDRENRQGRETKRRRRVYNKDEEAVELFHYSFPFTQDGRNFTKIPDRATA